MKSKSITLGLTLLTGFSAVAGWIENEGDLAFLERYAFSTNRQAVIDTLHPKTREWFLYSLLNAQTEGRIDDAEAILKEWGRHFRHQGIDPSIKDLFEERQKLLRCDAGKGGGRHGQWALDHVVGRQFPDKLRIPPREVEVKPSTYPSSLDQKIISFESILKEVHPHPAHLADNFHFLAFRPEVRNDVFNLDFYIKSDATLDAPFYFDLLLDYYASDDQHNTFNGAGVDRQLTLPQLAAVAEKLAGTPKDVRKSAIFADIVLGKLVQGADDDPDDPVAREELLKRRFDFTRTLAPSLLDRHTKVLRELLDFYRFRADFAHQDLFLEYLAAVRPENGHVQCDDFVRDWIIALRQSGTDSDAFAEFIEEKTLARLFAEADILSGVPAGRIDVDIFSPQELKDILGRVELKWTGSNKPVFAADDDVALDIDVKGVTHLRVAIYDLDAFAACCAANGEVRADIDLDCAVANSERAIDFNGVLPAVRHRERIDLPELKRPGLYVVECSASGVSSRAVVRKGRLRVTERRSSSGHIFTALDETGSAVRGARLKVDGAVFEADETGEIAVPFAATPKQAVRKTAVVGADRLASTVEFDHAAEALSLRLEAILSQESLVAGCEATALLRPILEVSGVQAPVELLGKPSLSIAFRDLHGRASVVAVPDFAPSSSEEGVVSFHVPRDLREMQFRLVAYAKRASDGETVRLEAVSAPFGANAIMESDIIRQLFLRHSTEGYVIECRGRTGERIPNRAFDVSLRHKAFSRDITRKLQGDENGEIHLGELIDISEVKCGGASWALGGDAYAGFPKSLSAAEGEVLEIPARGLLDGAWPGARELASRVSLLSANPDGAFTGDYIGACSYTNGILRVAGLPAGDYRLALRAENIAVPLRVAKTDGAVGDGGVIASAARALPDSRPDRPLRIASAKSNGKGGLEIQLENANGDTRVHVFARRTAPDATDFPSPAKVLAAAPTHQDANTRKWSGTRSEYISGRDLGDKLRYILDRRQEPRRIGNMLDKPSLLLSPWSTTETTTGEITHTDGNAWENSPPPASAHDELNDIVPQSARVPNKGTESRFSFDFLPGAAKVAANMKPGKNGSVTVDLAPFMGMRDFTVVAFDGLSIDEMRLTREAAQFQPRDMRLPDDFDPFADAGVEKRYSTVADLHRLLSSLDPSDATFREFGFVAGWGVRTDAEKRELYGKYACHELDLFLHEKDPKFFNEVVAPNLRNKRFKQFMDKWLLGVDISASAAPGQLQDLNALEQCLLAMRDDRIARVVARLLADKCAAAPKDLDGDEARLAIALDEMGADAPDAEDAELAEGKSPAYDDDELEEYAFFDAAPRLSSYGIAPKPTTKYLRGASAPAARGKLGAWSNQRALVGDDQRPLALGGIRNIPAADDMRRVEMARRKARQFHRPPECTKEWVESHYWRRRHSEDTTALVPAGRFWRDLASAVADGRLDTFRPTSVIHAISSFTEKMAALAFMRVGFEDGGGSVVFSRGNVAEGGDDGSISVIQRFIDPEARDADGNAGAEVTDEFVAGSAYKQETVLMNPTSRRRRVRLHSQIPCGAIALEGGRKAVSPILEIAPYSVVSSSVKFYFPITGDGVGRLVPAVVSERGAKCANGAPFKCNVVAVPSKTDTTSWRHVSQNGTDDEVLAFLERENLVGLDLAKIGWRMSNAEYAEKVLKVLESRGAYNDKLWLSGFQYDRFYNGVDAVRFRQALSRRENLKVLAPVLGPVLKSSIIEIEPERDDVFEHREYWPVINARTHSRGGSPTIPNEALAAEYRAFLNVIAAKKTPTPADRLLAAVYLLAQDRVDEAAALVATVAPGDVETKMQLDYIQAYIAFSAGRPRVGRDIAAKYAGRAIAPWDRRFREMVALADEIAGGKAPESEASSAPALSLRAEMTGGALEAVVIASRNLESCEIKAYPVDVEIAFSKNPFGDVASGYGNAVCVRPAWSDKVLFDGKGEERVALPKGLRNRNLVIVASGVGGCVEERLEVMPGALDVQVSRGSGLLFVRDAKGKALPAAYVKVYAKDPLRNEVRFYKDGYTDLRGIFDYASVSLGEKYDISEFAVLVLHDTAGAKTFQTPPPNK